MKILFNLVLATAVMNLGVTSAQTASPFAPHNTVSYVTYTDGVARNTTHTYTPVLKSKKLTGDIIISRPPLDSKECQGLCDMTDGCVGYSKGADGTGCVLFSQVTGSNDDPAYDSFIMNERMIKEYSNIDFADSLVSRSSWFPTKNSTLCQITCAQTPKCLAAVLSNGNCYLRSGHINLNGTTTSTTAFVMSPFNNADGGFTFNGALLDRYGPMQTRDRMISANADWAIQITWENYLELSYLGIPVQQLDSDVTSIEVLDNGQVLFKYLDSTQGTAKPETPGSGCKTGLWRLEFNGEALRTVTLDGKNVCYQQTFNPDVKNFWSWSDLSGQPDNEHNRDAFKPWGGNSHIYVLDSGMSNDNDASGQSISRWMNLPQVEGEHVIDATDYAGHGSMMMQLAKNHDFGISYNSRVYNVKITANKTDNFTEKAVVKAMKTAYYNFADSSTTKIINFSGYFPNGSAPVDCAMQWLFKSGALVVHAAGNSNTSITSVNPFTLTVGAYNNHTDSSKANITSYSGYGPGVDLYGPESFINYRLEGSSVATAMTSVVLAYAISKFNSKLVKRPQRAYRFLLEQARTDILDSRDPKNNPRNLKTLSAQSMLSLNVNSTAGVLASDYTDISITDDYCAQLGFTEPTPSRANWDTLIQKANSSIIGTTVITRYKPSMPLL